jgi:protein-S-isoprenylcysteine O-methyltransferase Ste14
MTTKLILFLFLSIPITFFSWRTLFHVKSHGFPRYFAWEGMAWLLASNFRYWFNDPFSLHQLIAWTLLFIAIIVVALGGRQFLKQGKADPNREAETLFGFEKTTALVDDGIYRYIRHPLYASLIYLAWGIYFKHPSWELTIVVVCSTYLLYLTMRYDEKECIAYFGEIYRNYMKRSHMFIPFVL